MEEVQEAEIAVLENRNEGQDELTSPSSNHDHSMDVDVRELRLWTALAPQDISLMLRLDLRDRSVSLTLRNDAGYSRFIWQNWVDAAMGYIKGCGRDIVRPDLSKPMLELCPLRMNEDERTKTVRVWQGWPVFDMQICKFELEQWLDPCDINLSMDLEQEERLDACDKIEWAEGEIGTVVWPEDEEMQGSKQFSEV